MSGLEMLHVTLSSSNVFLVSQFLTLAPTLAQEQASAEAIASEENILGEEEVSAEQSKAAADDDWDDWE